VVRGRHTGEAAVALAAIVLWVAGGAALDPAALGTNVAAASSGVVATGRVTTVTVVVSHMRFVPSSVDMPAGNRLVLVVTNRDTEVHDLVLETGQNSGRITRGTTVRLDAGVIGRSVNGWCTIVGHRQMGMLFAVRAIGGTGGPAADGTSMGSMAHEDASPTAGASVGGHEVSAARDLDFMARPGAGSCPGVGSRRR